MWKLCDKETHFPLYHHRLENQMVYINLSTLVGLCLDVKGQVFGQLGPGRSSVKFSHLSLEGDLIQYQ